MRKYEFSGKNYEEAVNNAKISLQELEDELIIKEKETKSGLFSKKVIIEVIPKSEVVEFLKEYIKELTKNMGLNTNIEIKKREKNINITIYADNNSILIGKNGKNMDALVTIVRQAVQSEIKEPFNFTLDVNDYKEKKQEILVREAKKIAREVGRTKIEAKLDPMNSYERRLIHTALADNKYVTTESIGEEPNRCLVIKPKETKENKKDKGDK